MSVASFSLLVKGNLSKLGIFHYRKQNNRRGFGMGRNESLVRSGDGTKRQQCEAGKDGGKVHETEALDDRNMVDLMPKDRICLANPRVRICCSMRISLCTGCPGVRRLLKLPGNETVLCSYLLGIARVTGA